MTEAQIADQTPTMTTANPSEGAPTSSNGTDPSGSGQTQTNVPAQETFTDIDPKTLSPDDLSKYNHMLRDYTAKTQQYAELRKKYEGVDIDALKQKAEQADRFEQLLRQQQMAQTEPQEEVSPENDPELLALWQEGQTDPAKAIEFHRRVAEKEAQGTKKIAEEAKQAVLDARAEAILDSFIDAVDPKTGQKLRPDFGEINETGLIQLAFDRMLQGRPKDRSGNPILPEKEWGRAMETSYQEAKKTYEAIFERGYKSALAKQQEKVSASTERPTASTQSDIENITPEKAKKLSVADAVRLARQGKVLAKTY